MKRLVILCICWYMATNCHSQNYIAEYFSEDRFAGKLLFNANEWRYDIADEMTIEIKDITVEGVGIAPDDSDIKDTSSKIGDFTSFFYRSLNKNYYLDEEMLVDIKVSSKYIKGELIKPEWTIISDSTKTIENYTCLMAKGHVRGRDYTVWFTPDIPVTCGPWKLWGLPGLIINAQSDDNVVTFSMISLKQTDLEIVEPIVEKTITPEEYKILFQEGIKKISRNLRSLLGDNIEDAEFTTVNTSINHPDKSLIE